MKTLPQSCKLSIAPLTLVGAALLALGLAAGADPADAGNVCRSTADRVAQSCLQGARSDRNLALAKCENLSDPSAEKDCKSAAETSFQDATTTCNDGHDARFAECDRLGGGPYDPQIDPANFVAEIDNPLYPLKPGTTFVYDGTTAEGAEHRELRVTHRRRTILGVSCVEVRDRVIVNGALIEDTLDWFAQDRDGNVWYFGENSKQVEEGRIVGLEGTWTGGVDGAKPGIIMEAHNAVGDFYRQEFSLDNAEDVAEVQSLDESVTVPFGSFDHCLKTLETTPLDINDISNKFYCPGVGEVMVQDLPPGNETLRLVAIKKD